MNDTWRLHDRSEDIHTPYSSVKLFVAMTISSIRQSKLYNGDAESHKMAYCSLKGRHQSFNHLEREVKSACKEVASDEDFGDMKHLVSSM